MLIENNISLKKYNTFHIDAKVKNFFIPENELELLELLEKFEKNNDKYYILSGGSNVLLNDNIEYENIIFMKSVDKSRKFLDSGKFYFGASNRIQEIIKYANEFGYGGIEELYSLPAFFGGIIYMNAGIGGKNNILLDISQFILRVKVINIKEKKIEWLQNEECEFEYRRSKFHNNEYVILGAEINLIEQEQTKSKERIAKRLSFCKENQEWGNGCFGTCFLKANGRILKFVKLIKPSSKDIRFGKSNSNWLVNVENGKYDDAIKLINLCILFHKICFQKIELEIKIFE